MVRKTEVEAIEGAIGRALDALFGLEVDWAAVARELSIIAEALGVSRN